MNATSLKLALGLFALAGAPALTGCGTPEDADAAATAEVAVGKTSAALASCYDPIRNHANWIAASPYTNFVSAGVRAPGLSRVMWIDTQRATYIPGICLPGRPCLPASWSYTISGTFNGDSISVDSAGYMTINGVRVTPSACAVPSPGSTVISGTSATGATYTVTLVQQYLG